MAKKKPISPVHIGQAIRQKFHETPLTYEKLGAMVLTTKQNILRIFGKEDINTTRLWQLSVALNYNFFDLFGAEEPLRNLRNAQIEALNAEVSRLQQLIEQQEKMIRQLEQGKKSDDKVIALLEEKQEQYEKRNNNPPA